MRHHQRYQYTPATDAISADHAKNADSSDSLEDSAIISAKLTQLQPTGESSCPKATHYITLSFYCDLSSVENKPNSQLTIASSTTLCPRCFGSKINPLSWIRPHTAVPCLFQW